jgi:hypothetical protein
MRLRTRRQINKSLLNVILHDKLEIKTKDSRN